MGRRARYVGKNPIHGHANLPVPKTHAATDAPERRLEQLNQTTDLPHSERFPLSSPTRISDLLSRLGEETAFSCKRSRSPSRLRLEVEGVGELGFPVSPSQAEALCRVARPARYGHREKTLLDRSVRDTWEVPKHLVTIDQEAWRETLESVLESMAEEMGVASGSRLTAELHALLVYQPGQFFQPHQDSEKTDSMVGTLVVILPSRCKGGELIVEHQGQTAGYRGTEKDLSFVAFYADCLHELKPVESGYRISLTYNLSLVGGGAAEDSRAMEKGSRSVFASVTEALSESLKEHFETPRASWNPEAPPNPPARRLIYLLDHQYTQRGLGWHRLKGKDLMRCQALLNAAEVYGCEAMLALAEIREVWHCMEPGWNRPYGRRHRSWRRGGDDEWHDEDPIADGPDDYELVDLIDSEISLTHWLDIAGERTEPIVTRIESYEVCASTPTSELSAYSSEYEGFMGNYGNTMDRWYRRAAVVLWPKEMSFAVRAEASATWALETLNRHLQAGEMSEARDKAATMLPFWERTVYTEDEILGWPDVLEVAAGLSDPETAEALLHPYRLADLAPDHAQTLVNLVSIYGEDWFWDLLDHWSSSAPRYFADVKRMDPAKHLASMPRISRRLLGADASIGRLTTELLLQDRWIWLQTELAGSVREDRPSRRQEMVSRLADPILGMLETTAMIEEQALRDEILGVLTDPKMSRLLPALTLLLRKAQKKKRSSLDAEAVGLEELRAHCIQQLRQRLEPPARSPEDWSITPPKGCGCELCRTLGSFLGNASKQRLDWPIAKEKRRHIHNILDDNELPVSHQTHRSGSPYTLVLTKLPALHAREAEERKAWQDDLEWLMGCPGDQSL